MTEGPRGFEHRLAAIISGDVAGYSRLMAHDEDAAVRLVIAYREEVQRLVDQHRGRLVDFTGDAFLAEFPSSLSAIRCAVEIQDVIQERNRRLSAEGRMEFRLGVHQGEVRAEGERLFGTGVNIAARLHALAEPGRICISAAVYEQLRGNLEIDCEDLGEKFVKNIPTPVHVYRVGPGTDRAGRWARLLRPSRRHAVGAAGLVALSLVGVAAWLGLRDGGPDGASGTGTGLPALPDRPSIVVLPFANMSDDPEQEYFADGIAEDLTTDLSRIPQLFVIARNSAFTYKGKTQSVGDIGRELGVRYVLEGSVRKADGRVRITAQLIDATSDFHLWSERYDRQLADIFALQTEIAQEILRALHIEIHEAELERIRREPRENLTAYESWMRGRAHVRRFTRSDIDEGRRLLERAIELDPTYAEAYAELANSYLAEFAAWNPDPALVGRAAPLARRALELNPLSAEALVSLANVEMGMGRAPEALALTERALALAPSSFDAQTLVGVYQLQSGRIGEGLQSLDRAVRLSPRVPDFATTMLGAAHYRAGHLDRAVEHWERVRAANPDATMDRIWLANHYQRGGREDEARVLVAEVLRVNPGYTVEVAARWFATGGLAPEIVADNVLHLQMAGLPSRPAVGASAAPAFAESPGAAAGEPREPPTPAAPSAPAPP